MPTTEYLLRVEAPTFVAGALITQVGDVWKVTSCAPILRRALMGRTGAEVKQWLTDGRHRYRWQWM